ncbi:MAG: transposase [Hymenobacter sp.]|nr:transposase [Hymenobacter sp.]
MKKSRFSEAQLIGILRQQGQGQTGAQICREHSTSEPTFYQWKSKYGDLELTELQQLKHLEEENRRLKQLVADLSLENQVVKEVLLNK